MATTSESKMSDADVTRADGPVEAQKRRLRRTRTGVVESDVRDKTIKVRIDRLVKHAKYGKYLRRRSRFHAHDERNEARCGDVVEIMECRPLSKTKSWRLARIIRRFATS